MGDVLVSYINHKESKMEGDVGILERKHLYVDGLVYTGKEASNLERTGIVDDVRYETYMSDEDLLERITSLSLEEAKNLGIPRRTLYRLKKNLRERKEVRLRRKTRYKL